MLFSNTVYFIKFFPDLVHFCTAVNKIHFTIIHENRTTLLLGGVSYTISNNNFQFFYNIFTHFFPHLYFYTFLNNTIHIFNCMYQTPA